MRKRTSIIWTIPLAELQDIINSSTSYREVLRRLGFNGKGGNFKTLKERIKEDNLDISHIACRSRLLNARIATKIPNDKLFTKDSVYGRQAVKKRIIDEDLVVHDRCAICNMGTIWNGAKLVFVLDHINGISNDHRLENLRFLCPNCNSQQDTFAGRNNIRIKKPKCPKCRKPIRKHSTLCVECAGKGRRKVERPSKKQLDEDINNMPMTAVGEKYGVSDNAIRKWLKAYAE